MEWIMKSTASLAAVSLCLISAYAQAINFAPPVAKAFNYEDGAGTWTKWVNSTNAVVTTQGIVADNTTGPSGNHTYQITVTLPPAPTNSASYLYFYLPQELALYGSLNLTGNFKAEVISGDGSQADVRLGTNLYNEAFGIYGNCGIVQVVM